MDFYYSSISDKVAILSIKVIVTWVRIDQNWENHVCMEREANSEYTFNSCLRFSQSFSLQVFPLFDKKMESSLSSFFYKINAQFELIHFYRLV